jgi:hypothetical protein
MRRHLLTSAAALAAAIASFGTAGAAFADGPAATSGNTVATSASAAPAATPSTTGSSTATTSSSTTASSTTPTATKPGSTKPGSTKPGTKPSKGSTGSNVAPTAAATKATAAVYLPDVFVVRKGAVTVPGRVVHVQGVVKPYVPGQVVQVKEFLGKRQFKSDTLRIKPAPGGRSGVFTEKLRSSAAGLATVTVTHARTPQMQGFEAVRRVAVLSPHAGFGSTGAFVQLIQQRLAALHIYVIQSGVYDQHTGLALDAYHRLVGRGTSQDLDGPIISDLLNGVGTFKLEHPGDGTHAEGNLGKQLLALAEGSKVEWIFPISSGKPSTPTILGHFHVYERTPGYLPDGMYYSDFFYGGYAIHGYDPAPDYPASHGCMRLPITDAIFVFNWLNYGDVVDVYYP